MKDNPKGGLIILYNRLKQMNTIQTIKLKVSEIRDLINSYEWDKLLGDTPPKDGDYNIYSYSHLANTLKKHNDYIKRNYIKTKE